MNNTNKFVTLTPEQINQAWDRSCLADPTGSNQRFVFARAIESAATAPLLARIAELERECVSLRNTLEQARQQMERQKDELLLSLRLCERMRSGIGGCANRTTMTSALR